MQLVINKEAHMIKVHTVDSNLTHFREYKRDADSSGNRLGKVVESV